jgi:hypothetical protein
MDVKRDMICDFSVSSRGGVDPSVGVDDGFKEANWDVSSPFKYKIDVWYLDKADFQSPCLKKSLPAS